MNAHTVRHQEDLRSLTVGALIEILAGFDPRLPIVFRSPHAGVFGADIPYAIHRVDRLTKPEKERDYPGGTRENEDTGELETYEPFKFVTPEWHGYVIS